MTKFVKKYGTFGERIFELVDDNGSSQLELKLSDGTPVKEPVREAGKIPTIHDLASLYHQAVSRMEMTSAREYADEIRTRMPNNGTWYNNIRRY